MESYSYPNGVTHSYNYNTLNRLTSMSTAAGATTLSSYTYTLGPTGNRTAVSELGGRSVSYSYDDLYRLTNETIANDPLGINGSVGYNYDAVGNRLSRTSSVTGVPSQTSTFDANDRLNSDNYDANGNTTASNSNSYAYDFENRLTSLNNGSVTYVYDGDGNRTSKTVNGVTTNYLVDTNNHTGYAQVVEELQSGSVTRSFTFGHDLISQRIIGGPLSFYSYDGHGSVRQLSDASATITDTYSYDAFGILIHRSGTTPNDYLYAGEQFDVNLGFQYLRARYLNPQTGRFWSIDKFEGSPYDPISLHKYIYANGDPVARRDPSGFVSTEMTVALAVASIIAAIAIVGLVYVRTRPQPTRFVRFEWKNNWTFGNETLSAPEIEGIKSGAVESFRAAFAGFGVVVSDGSATNRILVEGFSGSEIGKTIPFSEFSWVYYDDISIFARRFAQERKISDRAEILHGIARAIGRVAAHEFGHQGVSGGFVFDNTVDPATYDYHSGDNWQLYYGDMHWSNGALERMRKMLPH